MNKNAKNSKRHYNITKTETYAEILTFLVSERKYEKMRNNALGTLKIQIKDKYISK